MWLALIIMLISYFCQPRDTAAERKRALIGAAAAGAVTYGVMEYTDWGQENLKPLDTKIDTFFTGEPTPTSSPTTTDHPDGTATSKVEVPKIGTTTGEKSTQVTNGWDVLKDWGATGTATVVAGTGAVVGLATGNTALWVAGGVVAALVLSS